MSLADLTDEQLGKLLEMVGYYMYWQGYHDAKNEAAQAEVKAGPEEG